MRFYQLTCPATGMEHTFKRTGLVTHCVIVNDPECQFLMCSSLAIAAREASRIENIDVVRASLWGTWPRKVQVLAVKDIGGGENDQ